MERKEKIFQQLERQHPISWLQILIFDFMISSFKDGLDTAKAF